MTTAGGSLLVGDEVGQLLVEYAALVAQAQRAEHVTFRGLEDDGAEVEAHCVLSAGVGLLLRSTFSSFPEPDNSALVADR